MRKYKKYKQKIARALLLGVFILNVLGTATGTITREPDMNVTYTMSYERDSSQFGMSLLNLQDRSYRVDAAPGDSFNTSFYQVSIADAQESLFNSTVANTTHVRVENRSVSVNYSSVQQEDDFIIPTGESATWKLDAEIQTTPAQTNASSIDMTVGSVASGTASNLNEDDSNDVDFAAERAGANYTRQKDCEPDPAFSFVVNDGIPGEGYYLQIDEEYKNINGLSTEIHDDDVGAYYYAFADRVGYPPSPAYDAYYEYTLTFHVSTKNAILLLNRYCFSPFAWYHPVNVRWWYKAFFYNNIVSQYESVYNYEAIDEFSSISNPVFRTNDQIIPEDRHFKAVGIIYPPTEWEVRVKIRAGIDIISGQTGVKVKDYTTYCAMKQQDETFDGIIELDDSDVLRSAASIDIDIDTNCAGTFYYYTTAGTFSTLFTLTGGFTGRKSFTGIAMNTRDPKLRFVFNKESGATLTIEYVNVSAYIVPAVVTLNVTHEIGNEVLQLFVTNAIHHDTTNLTVEYEVTSEEFVSWDHEDPLYVPVQALNVTFTVDRWIPAWITFNVNYSVNSFVTPSEVGLTVNEDELIDTSINAGIVEFGDFQENLEFTTTDACYARVQVTASMTLQRSINFVTKTLIRDSWALTGITNMTIEKIEIAGVSNISKVYLGGTQIGTTASIILDYPVQRGSTVYLSIVLGAPVYKRLENLYAINKVGTVALDIYGAFNSITYNNIGRGTYEFTTPDGHAFNASRLTFQGEQTRTYMNESFGDGDWDGASTSANTESSMTVSGGSALLNATHYTHDVTLDVQDDFAYSNQTYNYTGLVDVNGNAISYMDNDSIVLDRGIDDDFQDYTLLGWNEGESISGATHGGTWAIGSNAEFKAHEINTMRGQFKGLDTSTRYVTLTLNESKVVSAGDYITMLLCANQTNGAFAISVTGSALPVLLLYTNGTFCEFAPSSPYTLIPLQTYTAYSDYEIEVHFCNATSFYVMINGTTYDNAGANFTTLDSASFGTVTGIRIQSNWFSTSTSGKTMQVDNVCTSWSSLPYGCVADFETYLTLDDSPWTLYAGAFRCYTNGTYQYANMTGGYIDGASPGITCDFDSISVHQNASVTISIHYESIAGVSVIGLSDGVNTGATLILANGGTTWIVGYLDSGMNVQLTGGTIPKTGFSTMTFQMLGPDTFNLIFGGNTYGVYQGFASMNTVDMIAFVDTGAGSEWSIDGLDTSWTAGDDVAVVTWYNASLYRRDQGTGMIAFNSTLELQDFSTPLTIVAGFQTGPGWSIDNGTTNGSVIIADNALLYSSTNASEAYCPYADYFPMLTTPDSASFMLRFTNTGNTSFQIESTSFPNYPDPPFPDFFAIHFLHVPGNRKIIQLKNTGSTMENWDSSTGNDWEYETWIGVQLDFNWQEHEITFTVSSKGTKTIDFVNVNATLARLRFYKPAPVTPRLAVVHIDALRIESHNEFNYTFDAPELVTVALTLNISVLTTEPIQFWINSTLYQYDYNDAGVHEFTFNATEFSLCINFTMNVATFDINFTYTSVQCHANVSTTLSAEHYRYCASLMLAFDAIITENGTLLFESGGIALEFLLQNGSVQFNITQELLDADLDLADLDNDSLVIIFGVAGNGSLLVLDNITFWDESLKIFVNSTWIGEDLTIDFDIDANTTNYDVSRLNDDVFNVTFDYNATWHSEHAFTEMFAITQTWSPDTLLHENITSFTSEWYWFSNLDWDYNVFLFIDSEYVENAHAIGVVYIETERVFTRGDSINYYLRTDVETSDSLLLAQIDQASSLEDTAVTFQAAFLVPEAYSHYYCEFDDALSISAFTLIFEGSTITTSREGNTFYFASTRSANDLLIANVTIDPRYTRSVIQISNNGTDCTFSVALGADLNVQNVTCQLDLSSYQVYMHAWNVSNTSFSISQAENRIVTFVVSRINSTVNTLYLHGSADIPVASIRSYAIQPYVVLDVDAEITYQGYLSYPVYSRAFQLNLSQLGNEYVLDGVHYNNATLDVDETGTFTCTGWGTGITSSYVQFTAKPVLSIVQERTGNQVKLTIYTSLPVLESWYVLQITDDDRRMTFNSNNYTHLDYGNNGWIIQHLNLKIGENIFYFNIKIIEPWENLIYILPVLVVFGIITLVYYTRNHKIDFKDLKVWKRGGQKR